MKTKADKKSKASRNGRLFLFLKIIFSVKIQKLFKKRKRRIFLKRYEIKMEPAAANFYETLARRTGTSAEKLMASVLFNFAGELSVKAILENIKGEN